jgi:hypothetical protein
MKQLLRNIKEAFSSHNHQTDFRCVDTITGEEYKVTIPHYNLSITTWEASDYIKSHTSLNPVNVKAY